MTFSNARFILPFESIVGDLAIKVPEDIVGTRERLLEAAGAVFADRGFQAATVREICRRAEVNVAAVNYHFRDKEHLYETVLKNAHRYAMETHPPTMGLGPDASPEQRLEGFVRSLVWRLTDKGRPAWHGLLMIRELTHPTAALDALVNESIRPLYEYMCSVVKDLLGPGVSMSQVRLCVSSLVGQCMHFQVAREMLLRLNPDINYDAESIEAVCQHITRFSLSAIRCLREQSGKGGAA